MNGLPNFNPRSDALKRRDEPGKGDDVPCVKCGGALDTGLECIECENLDSDQKAALWYVLPSNVRAGLKKEGEARRANKPAVTA